MCNEYNLIIILVRCLFFEPQLTHALHRTFVFPLQHLCRSVIASRLEYNDLAKLNIPRKLNEYLREYHYKQAVSIIYVVLYRLIF